MDCREYRTTYTDLLDGLLEEAEEVRFHAHVAACAECRRFDRAYRLGVAALRGLPYPCSSRDFTARVLHAVRVDSRNGVPSLASGFAGAALVVALVGFLALDLRGPKYPAAAASTGFRDSALAVAPPDRGPDPVVFPLRDATMIPPFWARRASRVRNADLSSGGAFFAVPVAWTGR